MQHISITLKINARSYSAFVLFHIREVFDDQSIDRYQVIPIGQTSVFYCCSGSHSEFKTGAVILISKRRNDS